MSQPWSLLKTLNSVPYIFDYVFSGLHFGYEQASLRLSEVTFSVIPLNNYLLI